MGNKKLGLLLMIYMYLDIFSVSSSVQKGLPSDKNVWIVFVHVSVFVPNHTGANITPAQVVSTDSLKDIQHEHGTRTAKGENYARSGIAHDGKIARGIGSGGSTGAGEHSTNGGSRSPYAHGGAESDHHPQTLQGAGSCSRNCEGLLTFITTIIASLLHLYIGLQN